MTHRHLSLWFGITKYENHNKSLRDCEYKFNVKYALFFKEIIISPAVIFCLRELLAAYSPELKPRRPWWWMICYGETAKDPSDHNVWKTKKRDWLLGSRKHPMLEYNLKLRHMHVCTLLYVLYHPCILGILGNLNGEEQKRISAWRSCIVHLCQVVMVSTDLAVVYVCWQNPLKGPNLGPHALNINSARGPHPLEILKKKKRYLTKFSKSQWGKHTRISASAVKHAKCLHYCNLHCIYDLYC